MHPRLSPLLLSLLALCTAVSLTLPGRVASETPATEAAKAEGGSAGALQEGLSALAKKPEETSSAPRNHLGGSGVLHVDALKAEDESAKARYQELLAKVKEQGSLPLILGLSTPTAPENDLDRDEVARQRRRIEAAQDDLLTDLAGVATEGVKRFETVPYLALSVDAAGLAELVDSEPVLTVDEDVAFSPALLDSVPIIRADRIHRGGVNGSGVAVAILDTGVDKTHPFLDGGKVISEACYSSTLRSQQATSVCPGGVASSTAPGSGAPCDHPGCNHGTHVAGVAAGRDGTGAIGGTLQGTAPGASIIAIQVFSRVNGRERCEGRDSCIRTYTSDWFRGLQRVYALRNTYNIAAANLSLGGGRVTRTCHHDIQHILIRYSINRLRAAGIATVIAAGNDGWDGATNSPACISSAITVGASDKRDRLWRSSNHASWVDMIAPGVSIQSSIPGTAYLAANGTSAAAPHVAGCFALFAQRKPMASITMMEKTLKSAATVFISRGGISKPRIDCYPAVMAPGATTLVSPMGMTGDPTPEYTWTAVSNATSYQLWVDRGASPALRTWYTAAQAGCAVGNGNCRVTPSTVLDNGAHTWRIQARNSHGKGPWSDRQSFAVNSPPDSATPISPQGVTIALTPTYRWRGLASASSYLLWVDRGDTGVIRTWYTAEQAGCTDGVEICAVTPDVVLQKGGHSWRIWTRNSRGLGPWDPMTKFLVSTDGPPRATHLIAPQGETADTMPTYSWKPLAIATSYQLRVDSDSGQVFTTWYTAKQAGCAGDTGNCRVTTDTALLSGAHTWWIQARNSHGRGPWSASLAFTVIEPPGVATPVAPKGTISDATPTYRWKALASAESYQLWIGRGSDRVHAAQYTAKQAGCDGDTEFCRVTPSTTLQSGAHTWRIQARNSRGLSPWSALLEFTVRPEDPPPAATPVAPQSTTADTTPTYRWNAVATAASYQLRVDGSSGRLVAIWYTAAQAGCAAGTGICSVTPSTVLKNGMYRWQIQTRNAKGEGPWSGSLRFTVENRPGAAILLYPRGGTADATPTYRWKAVATATRYHLAVAFEPYRVYTIWYTAEQVGCAAGTGICSVTPSPTLQQTGYVWWIVTQNTQGNVRLSEMVRFRITPTPGAATPISPQGATSDTTPTFSWKAVAATTRYRLAVACGPHRFSPIWYTAEQAGCATGTGICRVTPSSARRGGAHSWWVQTANSKGPGLRSALMSFTVRVGGDRDPPAGDAD